MGYKRTADMDTDEEIRRQPPCIYLRSKAIYVTGDPDPQSEQELGSTRFNCWCNKTQHVIGPDQLLVERTECIEGRDCFCKRA